MKKSASINNSSKIWRKKSSKNERGKHMTYSRFPEFKPKFDQQYMTAAFLAEELGMSAAVMYYYERKGLINSSKDIYGVKIYNYTEAYNAIKERLKKNDIQAREQLKALKAYQFKPKSNPDTKAISPDVVTHSASNETLNEILKELRTQNETLTKILNLLN